MDLKSILSGLEGLKVKGSLDVEVNEIRNSSNLVQKGDMFVAIDGFDTDGHQYIGEAIQKGAKVIMAQADKITKEMVKAQSELKRAQGMLANEKFVSKAPANLIEAEKEKVQKDTDLISKMTNRLAELNK